MTYAAQIMIEGRWIEIGIRESAEKARQLAWSMCWDHNGQAHRIVDENDQIVGAA